GAADDAGEAAAALVGIGQGRERGTRVVGAGVDRRAAQLQGHGLGRPAVGGRVGEHRVGGGNEAAGEGARVAHQVGDAGVDRGVAAVDGAAVEVGDGGVARLAEDAVGDVRRARVAGAVAEVVDVAAAVGGGVQAEGAVEEGDGAVAVEDGAAPALPVVGA